VASLARPGGNLTGSTTLAAGLAQKRLELVREAAPQASRIAVLRYPVSRLDSLYWRETQQAAEVLGVTLNPVEVRDARELAGAFAAMTRARVGALVVFPDSFFFEHQVRIAELALKHEIPAIHDAREGQQAPGRHVWPPLLFFSLLLFVPWVGDSSEEYKALGLTIPPSVLAPADEVIE
jgi:putative ABC transport system substrate-binding protein